MKNIFSAFLLFFFTWQLSAQSFSNDSETFKQQVLQFLKVTNTQKSLKIEASFDESWHEQFNQGQKEKLIAIVKKIEEKHFSRTNYILLFEFITGLPLVQKIPTKQIDAILAISFSSLETLSKQEYTHFQKGLNEFIDSQNLYQSKFFISKILNPLYSFNFLGEVPTLGEDQILETSQQIDSTENDDWSSDDESWDNDANDDWPSDNGSWDNDTENNSTQINSDTAPLRAGTYSSEIDYVALQRAKYIPAVISGPYLHIDQASLILSTPFDSLEINNVKGNHVFKDRQFSGSSATIDWPKKYM